jgi:hypothetical protein
MVNQPAAWGADLPGLGRRPESLKGGKSMDAKALLKERTELFDNVFNFKHNKRVPVASNVSFWHILDAGYTYAEAVGDYAIAEKVNDIFCERYQFDSYMSLCGTMTLGVSRAFGNGHIQINETGDAIVFDDRHIMEGDEYQEYAKDPARFLWSKAFPRCCKPGFTMAQLEKTIMALSEFSMASPTIVQKHLEHGAMMHWKTGISTPPETIISFLRGIKEMSLDLRKRKDAMKETMDIMFARDCEPLLPGIAEAALNHEGYVAPVSLPMLAHSVLNEKQFEELYWPYTKKVIDFCVEKNIRIAFYCEAEILRFAEYFQDIPKGLAILQHEQDDVFELRKKLPNIALMGGMPLSMLGHAKPQECVDYAKKLIDTLGDGFVLCQDKMGLSKNDIKRENLLAVNEFARNYNY